MNRNPFDTGTTLLGALPFALLLLFGLAAAFGPRRMNALRQRAQRRARRWMRDEFPVLRRRAADGLGALRPYIQRVAAKAATGLPKE
jgi:hypothetical protein